jgi:protease I
MSTGKLDGKRIAILLTSGFEQVEMEKPRTALHAEGANTTLISPAKGTVQGMNHDEKGEAFAVDMAIGTARADDFDAVLLPGGVVNADKLRMDQDAQRFVQAMDWAGKPVAAICHGPWLLISAGLARGRHLTSYYTLQDDIRNAGGKWTDEELVADRNWISSRTPDDIPAFNTALIRLISHHHHAHTARP